MRNLLLVFTLLICSPALAQEFGGSIGFNQTTADSNIPGVSVDGKLNYKLGALVAFELADGFKFRSGLLYAPRNFDVKLLGRTIEVNLSYLDVPALVQFNVNEMVGLFGGMVFAFNTAEDVDVPAGITMETDVDKLIPLLHLGVNFLFQDMIGFDVYYERGLGEFAKHMENFSTFGANFIYWF